ncbi:hypothetical protein GGP41_009983 [Bipolaris sorokiniana]|uniref:Uncharacterized protein n=1 Tax=Cochliobolus sativus TaxID=45130 RepID=A0A8H5ZEQ6_COCSA|nr:hypothetical protein GGP41_009983 [Bipolaris sorokiniana]
MAALPLSHLIENLHPWLIQEISPPLAQFPGVQAPRQLDLASSSRKTPTRWRRHWWSGQPRPSAAPHKGAICVIE